MFLFSICTYKVLRHKYLVYFTELILKSFEQGEVINARASVLKEEVGFIFNNVVEPLDQLELIDSLQRLGLASHFQEEINGTLKKIQVYDDNREMDLHAAALKFRLLRQHGFFTSPGN